MEEPKKKIIVITTGGTIGSILQSDSVSVDLTASKIATEIDTAKEQLGYEVEVRSPLNKNSEVFGPADWLDILTSIESACNTDADGIVVTHGTDTMAYTVAAAVSFCHLWSKKVCFTGAFYSPDHPSSDTALSLLASLAFAASPHPASGVYVAFRDSNHKNAVILNGIDIKPMDFDETFFASIYNRYVATYSADTGLSTDICNSESSNPQIGNTKLPTRNEIIDAQKKVSCISLYPGIDTEVLSAVSKNKEVVIIQLYHSGTAPYGPEYSDVVEHLAKHSESTLFLMGTFPSEYIATPYESTKAIIASGGVIYKNIQAHFLYTHALLSLALGHSQSDIRQQLSEWEL